LIGALARYVSGGCEASDPTYMRESGGCEATGLPHMFKSDGDEASGPSPMYETAGVVFAQGGERGQGAHERRFDPMNANFGILPPLQSEHRRISKRMKRALTADRSLAHIKALAERINDLAI